jgi:small conductance mechanosensitive channel
MSDLATQILIIVVTMLAALGVGLYLRHILVQLLKKTVLDNWLIQVLGFLVIIPPVILGIVVVPVLSGWPPAQAGDYWNFIKALLGLPDYQSFIRNLIYSIIITVLAIGVGRTLTKLATRGMVESRLNINIRTLLGRLFYIVTMTIAFFCILFIWGNGSFTVPTAAISIITLGIAFVIQDILKNFVAGLYLLLEGPFQLGDYITTSNYTGKVEDVQLRATKLRILSGEQVIVPNAILFSEIVINKTVYRERRATITITMPQEEYDKAQATEHILSTIKEVSGVIEKPEPTLALSGIAGSFGSATGTVSGYTGEIITLTLHFWIPERQESVVSDAMIALRAALPRADLVIREPEEL